jgi:hypothetical protein
MIRRIKEMIIIKEEIKKDSADKLFDFGANVIIVAIVVAVALIGLGLAIELI